MKKACSVACLLLLLVASVATARSARDSSCIRIDSPVIFAPVVCGESLLFFGADGRNLVMDPGGVFSSFKGPSVSPSFQPVSDGECAWCATHDGDVFRIAGGVASKLPGDFRGAIALLPAEPAPYVLFPHKLRLPEGGDIPLDFTAISMNALGNKLWIRGNGAGLLIDSKGKIRWQWKVPGMTTGPALLSGKTVFTGASDGRFDALKKRNGKPVFSFRGGGSLINPPVVCKHLVVYGSTDHFIRALDTRNGMVLWQTRVEGRPSFGPIKVKAGILFAEGAGSRLFILSEDDGRVGWNWRVHEGAILRAPVVVGKAVFVAVWSGSSKPCLYRVVLPEKLLKKSSTKGKKK